MTRHTKDRWDCYAIAHDYPDIETMIRSIWASGVTLERLANTLGVTKHRTIRLAHDLNVSLARATNGGLPRRVMDRFDGRLPTELARLSSKQVAAELHVHVVTARRYLRLVRKAMLAAAREKSA